MSFLVQRFLNMIIGTKVRAIRPAVRANSMIVEAYLRLDGGQVSSYHTDVIVTLMAARSTGAGRPRLTWVE